MANHMEEVAKMLSVELEEEFEVEYRGKTVVSAKLTGAGLQLTNINGLDIYISDSSIILEWLLTGHCTVKRLPWKPNYGDSYYSIGPGGCLEPGQWLDDFIDIAMYKLGNCYRTVQEAEANKDKWIAFYESDEMLEV